LKHYFTVSITAHSISILSVLIYPPLASTQAMGVAKIFSGGRVNFLSSHPLATPMTQAQRRAVHQLRYQLHSVEGRAKCPFLNVVNSWPVYTRCWTRQ